LIGPFTGGGRSPGTFAFLAAASRPARLMGGPPPCGSRKSVAGFGKNGRVLLGPPSSPFAAGCWRDSTTRLVLPRLRKGGVRDSLQNYGAYCLPPGVSVWFGSRCSRLIVLPQGGLSLEGTWKGAGREDFQRNEKKKTFFPVLRKADGPFWGAKRGGRGGPCAPPARNPILTTGIPFVRGLLGWGGPFQAGPLGGGEFCVAGGTGLKGFVGKGRKGAGAWASGLLGPLLAVRGGGGRKGNVGWGEKRGCRGPGSCGVILCLFFERPFCWEAGSEGGGRNKLRKFRRVLRRE